MSADGDRIHRLHAITAARSVGFDQQVQQLIDLACDVFGMSVGAFARVIGRHMAVIAARSPDNAIQPGDRHEVHRTYSRLVLQTDDPIVLEGDQLALSEPHAIFGAHLPALFCGVVVRCGGRVYGTLAFTSEAPRPADAPPLDRDFLRLIAQWLGEALERQAADRRLRAQYEAARVLADALSLAEAAPRLLQAICQGLDWEYGELWLVDEAESQLRCLAAWHIPSARLAEFRVASAEMAPGVGEGTLGRAWAFQSPVWVADCLHDPGFTRAEAAERAGFHGALAFPIQHDGQVLGVVGFFSQRVEAPELALLTMLGTLGSQIGQFIVRKRAEARLVEALAVAQAATQAKSDFLANMSHELRTPLNSVIGFAELLDDELAGALNDEQRDFVRTIHRNGKHLLRLINELLDITKIESGKLALAIETMDLAAVIHEVCQTVAPLAARGSLTLVAPAETPVIIHGDPLRLRQVLTNLVSNAIKFTPAGGEVTVSVTTGPAAVTVQVRDTGIGIAVEDAEQVFEPFFQVDSSYARRQDGTGLGLPLARRLIELHGGQLWLETTQGQGSTFRFTLPLIPAAGPPGTVTRTTDPAAAESHGSSAPSPGKEPSWPKS